MSDINVGSVWQHQNNECYYTVTSVSSFKLGGTWLDEPLVTYKSEADDFYSRFESDFKASFTLIDGGYNYK